jgi:3-oxoacyl-[acyl-carrier-protein] synthase-1/3-oxoacyl-[acyl-carrier-protein] synthase II
MARVIAVGAVSPLGRGDAAWSVGELGAAATTTIARDDALVDAGLRKPFAARVRPAASATIGIDPATAILFEAFGAISSYLRRGDRIGVAVGSSSGAMTSATAFFAADRAHTSDASDARAGTYAAPFVALVARMRALDLDVARTTHVLTACASSTIAIGLGKRWLDADECDLVVAGGYDALTIFVAAGFEALGATTAMVPPRPLCLDRDGMSLGEGAGLLVLGPDARATAISPRVFVRGFGASGDAVHLTAPDRAAGGMVRAAARALDDGAVDASEIDLVSLHGTATPFNDPMESRAAIELFGDRAEAIPVCASKATIGHALGAAGALETALVIDALSRALVPATPLEGRFDTTLSLRPRSTIERADLRAALKLSAAFGGANAALVLARSDRPEVKRASDPAAIVERARAVVEGSPDLATLAARLGLTADRLARMDASTHLALAAVAALADQVGRDALVGSALVLGTFVATTEVNAIYDAGIAHKGARFAEARRFAYTTPNAAAGECAIAFALTGPNVCVGRGPDAALEADEVARDLLRGGDAGRVVVVTTETAGDLSRAIVEAAGGIARPGSSAWLLERVS